jgi:integrase
VVVDAVAAHIADFGTGDDGLLFCRADGRPLDRDGTTRAFRAAAAGSAHPRGRTCATCATSYASLLIRHGESVKVVQGRLGHASASETLDTYSHLWSDSNDLTRAAVDAVLGAPAGSVRTEQAY